MIESALVTPDFQTFVDAYSPVTTLRFVISGDGVAAITTAQKDIGRKDLNPGPLIIFIQEQVVLNRLPLSSVQVTQSSYDAAGVA
jgi:hypothetical protein